MHVNTATSGAGFFLRGRRLLPQHLVRFLRIERRFAPFLSFSFFFFFLLLSSSDFRSNRRYIGWWYRDLWTKETNVHIYLHSIVYSSSNIHSLLFGC